MLAFSVQSSLELLLPAANGNTSQLNIIASIRDRFDCVTELNLSSVSVVTDLAMINEFIDNVQSTNNFFANKLVSTNQNVLNQIVVSLSQHFDQLNRQAVQTAIAQGKFLESFNAQDLNRCFLRQLEFVPLTSPSHHSAGKGSRK